MPTLNDVITRVELVESYQGVQYIPGDADREAIIRGWGGLSATDDISRVQDLHPESWLLRGDDGGLTIVTDENYKRYFRAATHV